MTRALKPSSGRPKAKSWVRATGRAARYVPRADAILRVTLPEAHARRVLVQAAAKRAGPAHTRSFRLIDSSSFVAR